MRWKSLVNEEKEKKTTNKMEELGVFVSMKVELCPKKNRKPTHIHTFPSWMQNFFALRQPNLPDDEHVSNINFFSGWIREPHTDIIIFSL